MTSKNLFFKVIIQEWKQRIWCPVMILISMFLAMEVYLISALQRLKEHQYNNGDKLPVDFFANSFLAPDINSFVTVLTIIVAILCPFGVYGFVHSKQQTDLLHALPIKRAKLFFSKFVAGISFYLIPFILHLIICLGIASVNGAMNAQGISKVFFFFGIELLIYIMFYSGTTLCIMLTGRMVISFLACLVILPFSLVLNGIKEMLYERFFYSVVITDTQSIFAFSPVHLVVDLLRKLGDSRMDMGSIPTTLCYRVVFTLCFATLIYTLLAVWAYLKRPSEVAGIPVAFRVLEPVVKFFVVLICSFYAGELCVSLTVSDSFAWYLFGVFFTFLLTSLIMEGIFRLDIKSAWKHWQHLIFNGVCIVFILVVMKNDVFGFNTYIPSQDEIASISCSISGIFDSYVSYEDMHYANQDMYNLEHMELSDKDTAYSFAKKLSKEGLVSDSMDNNPYRTIYWKYTLNNGKSVYRKYNYSLSDVDTYQYLTNIFSDSNYKLGCFSFLQKCWEYDIKSVYCTSEWNMEDEFMISIEQKNRLLDAYQADIMQLTFDEIANTFPIGIMEFCYQVKNENYNRYLGGNLIYPSFAKTIAVMEEIGYDFQRTISLDDIREVKVIYYDSEGMSAASDKEVEKTYDSTEDIMDILSNSSSYTYLGYASSEGYYDVKITYMLDDEKMERYLQFGIDKVPDFVKKDIKELLEANE